MATNAHKSAAAAHRAWLEAAARIEPLGKVFITGVAKSGTTWLALMLDGHPDAVIRGEGGFAWRLLPCLQSGIQAFHRHCDEQKLAGVTRIGGAEFAAIFRQVVLGRLAAYVESAGKDASRLTVVGDKTPQHVLAMPTLAQAFPEAVFLHIVRDPRDAAVSAWHHFVERSGGRPEPIEAYALRFVREGWGPSVTAALRAGEVLGDRLLHVRYEDLHADPAGEMRRVLRHCGLNGSQGMLDRVLSAGSFERLSGGRARGEEDAGSFFRKGVVGDWANHFDPTAGQRMLANAAAPAERFGYSAGTARRTA